MRFYTAALTPDVMTKSLYIALTIVVGMFISLHLAMNGRLGGAFKSAAGTDVRAAAAANVFFWLIGALVAVAYYFILQPGSPLDFVSMAPKPLFLAGAMGASLVFAVTFLIPDKVGGAAYGFLFLVTGQVLMGLILSHFGWLGSPVDPVSIKKLAGLGLIALGVFVVVK
ncbi:MAG: DMT family transporter [Spirochaetia bacterium]|nr:DMT family transporter [Spirochaetia bacterium]